MQIAQIVPKIRTKDEGIFDYAIPPDLLPMIQPGILVEIPFHGRKLEGIVIGLKRYSLISHLSSLISVVDSVPAIDDIHIKLAKWMSEYYLEPLGKTLFENIVPPAKRTIKKVLSSNLTARTLKINKGKSIKYLMIGDFRARLSFYLKAIKRTIAQNKSVIILVPDLALIPYFTKNLKDQIAILHAKMTKTQRWLEWNKIRHGEINIVIGSQSALFAPVKNLGLIIIDQEENETYKNDRSPRFHAVTVAEQLSKLTAVNLVIGSLVPRIEIYYQAINGKYHILSHKDNRVHNNTTVDMNSEKYIISNTLEKEIEKTFSNKQKVLLVFNRKGEGTKFSCPDCGWIALCEKCGLPLIPQKSENICYRCGKSFVQPTACQKCYGVHLKPMGLGTKGLKKFLSDLFPDARIIQIEKDIDDRLVRSDWDIIITTTYGLKFKWPKIGLVGIIDADQGLNFPDFSSHQKTFQMLYKFLSVGERGIVQSHLSENYVIRALSGIDYKKFFLDEIVQRKKHQFPPFTQLVRLLYKDKDLEKVKKETARVYGLLRSAIRDKQYGISPPYPAFI